MAASTLTSGHLLGVLCLRPVQQVHLGGLLRGDAAPGPALVAKVMKGRGVLQLAGEIEAALQACKDSQWSVGRTVSPRGPPSPTPPLQEGGLHLIHNPHASRVDSGQVHSWLGSIWLKRGLREKKGIPCIIQVKGGIFREGR